MWDQDGMASEWSKPATWTMGMLKPEWLSAQDLQHIGMPVGGICCGQVYLSGKYPGCGAADETVRKTILHFSGQP